MDAEEQLHNLIGKIYEAAIDHSLWDSLIRDLANHLQANRGAIRLLDENREPFTIVGNYGSDDDYLERYKDYFIECDPFLEPVENQPAGLILHTLDAFSDQEFEQTEFYYDHFRHFDHFYTVGGHIIRDDYTTAAISLQRPRDAGAYSAVEIQLLQQLIPHIQRSFRMCKTFSELLDEKLRFKQVIDKLSYGILIFNDELQIIYHNTTAEKLIERNINCKLSNKRLWFKHPNNFQHLVQESVTTGLGYGNSPGGIVRVNGINGDYLTIHVSPVSVKAGILNLSHNKACAIAFITNPLQRVELPIEHLRNLYSLSKREALLAQKLAQGHDLHEIAEMNDVKLSTIKTQLLSLFTKTGTQRQQDLIRVLLQSYSPHPSYNNTEQAN